jgi:hypothetical protein
MEKGDLHLSPSATNHLNDESYPLQHPGFYKYLSQLQTLLFQSQWHHLVLFQAILYHSSNLQTLHFLIHLITWKLCNKKCQKHKKPAKNNYLRKGVPCFTFTRSGADDKLLFMFRDIEVLNAVNRLRKDMTLYRYHKL